MISIVSLRRTKFLLTSTFILNFLVELTRINTKCVQSIQIFLRHQSVWCTRRDRTLSAWVKESWAKTVRWFSKWWLFIPRAVRNWVIVAIGLVFWMEKRRNPNEIKAKQAETKRNRNTCSKRLGKVIATAAAAKCSVFTTQTQRCWRICGYVYCEAWRHTANNNNNNNKLP